MTDREVIQAFDEVYNKFWLNYRDKHLTRESDEWERMFTWATLLMKKYPIMKMVIAEMTAELDQRMRRRENNDNIQQTLGDHETQRNIPVSAD